VDARTNREQENRIARAPGGPDFEGLYREHGIRLWRSVFAFAGDREVASDAVAEAFAQAMRRGAELRDPAGWIWRAAFRIAAGELKDLRRVPHASVPQRVEPTDPGSMEGLMEALGRLSPERRGAIVLHHYVGYSVKDAAEVLGSTSAAVRVHLSQGRKRLRTLLKEGPDED